VGTLAALSIFERLLHVITHGRLVNLLASAVLLNTTDSSASARSTKSTRVEADDIQPSISQVLLHVSKALSGRLGWANCGALIQC